MTWLQNEISRIRKIKELGEVQKEIISLDEKIRGLKVKKTRRGNYYYFYSYINLPRKPETIQEPLGRCLIENYEKNPGCYDGKNPVELKKILDRSYIKNL